MSDSEQLRADGDIWSLDGTTRKIHMQKLNSKDHPNRTIPWKMRRVVVSIENMLLSTELIESDIQNRIQKTQL